MMKSSRFCPAKSAIAMPLVLSIDKNEKRKLTAGKTTIHVFCTGMALVMPVLFSFKNIHGEEPVTVIGDMDLLVESPQSCGRLLK